MGSRQEIVLREPRPAVGWCRSVRTNGMFAAAVEPPQAELARAEPGPPGPSSRAGPEPPGRDLGRGGGGGFRRGAARVGPGRPGLWRLRATARRRDSDSGWSKRTRASQKGPPLVKKDPRWSRRTPLVKSRCGGGSDGMNDRPVATTCADGQIYVPLWSKLSSGFS